MELRRVVPAGRQIIQAYRSGSFTVSSVRFTGSVVILPDRTLEWPARSVSDLTIEQLQPLLQLHELLDVVILGTGTGAAPLATEVAVAFKQAGLRAETMATPPACRTYNILIGEDRRVGAALIAID